MRQRKGDQPIPTPGKENVQDALLHDVIQFADFRGYGHHIADDLRARTALGIQRYGTPLQTFNGRDAKRDLYEELIDAAQYAKQLFLETKRPQYRLMLWSILGLLFDLSQ